MRVEGSTRLEKENAGRRTFAGLFMVTLATLAEEILLTRVFSVTMWYHFVFLAVSLAMFGLTAGGLLVYLAPRWRAPGGANKPVSAGTWVLAVGTIAVYVVYIYYQLWLAAVSISLVGLAVGGLIGYLAPRFSDQAEVQKHLSASALGLAVTMVASFLAYLGIHHDFDFTLMGVTSLLTILGVISVPFVFSGVCVCFALTRFPRQVGRLYAADLSGAATGCIFIICALRFVDAPTAVVLSAGLAGIGAFLFAPRDRDAWLRRLALVCSAFILAFAAANSHLARKHKPILELAWVRGIAATPPIYEKWNSFSRVTVTGDPNVAEEPITWGLSPAYPDYRRVRQLHLYIDSNAFSVITRFTGDLQPFDYLKYDITNFVHYFRPNSDVVVVGAGGGRDVLSALAFGQRSVTAIEMNRGILEALNQTFGEFSGHLDRDPHVQFVNDEARSYLARMPGHVDIIQASLVDTWAATTAGAFALTENSIYTTEAWRLFLQRLAPRGLLTFTRWYDMQYPSETYRLLALASTALSEIGAANPRNHIIVVECAARPMPSNGPVGVATILVSKEPFSADDLELLQKLTGRMRFEIILSPQQAVDATSAKLASGKGLDELVKTLPGRIEAPTDDSPFFLCNFEVRDVFYSLLGKHSPLVRRATSEETLGAMFIAVTLLTILCVLVPLFSTGRNPPTGGATPLFLFFVAIGAGFMLVEVSQLQRLMIFLGHPTFSLSTVLFTLLLSSGLGSYSTGITDHAGSRLWPVTRLLALLAALALFGFLTPHAVATFSSAGTPARILVAAVILSPLGFFMGMAFPLGMMAASAQSEALTPWLWGLNGATSVLASVVAFLIVLGSGVTAAFWTGFACYLIALFSYLWAVRSKGTLSP